MSAHTRQVKGTAAGHLRTLHDRSAPPESQRRAKVHLRRMGFGDLVDSTGVVDRQPKVSVLCELGREAVKTNFERERFNLNRQTTLHQPHTPAIVTGPELARWLDQHRKPDERLRTLVTMPRIAQVQLGTDTGTRLESLVTTLQSVTPSFTEVDSASTRTMVARPMDVGGTPFTMIKQVQEVGRLARAVLLTDAARPPQPYAQMVQFFEHTYTAVDQEWAEQYLGDISTAAGQLSVARLVEAGDPEIAVAVGGMVWMGQQVRPLQP